MVRLSFTRMEGEKKNIVYVVIALIVIALLGWWLLSSDSSGSSGQSDSTPDMSAKEAPPAQVSPTVKLTPDEKSGDVTSKKAEILALVKTGKSLTSEQRSEITLIMLTKANIYQFSGEEQELISAALSRP